MDVEKYEIIYWHKIDIYGIFRCGGKKNMDNIILANLSAENFSSFADEIKFTTVVDSGKKEYAENTFPNVMPP